MVDQQSHHPASLPLVQEQTEDTLQYVMAVLHCLQHLDLKNGLDDEAELGFNLILDSVREALRYEVHRRHD